MKKIYFVFLLTFSFISILFSQAYQFRNNTAHTGLYSANEKFDAVQLQWLFKTDGAIRSTPLIVDNHVFFGSADHYFYCLDTNGNEAWKYKTENAVHSSPAYYNGVVFFTDRSDNLYALKASDGALIWKNKAGEALPYAWGFDYYTSSPLIVDKTLYTGSGDGNLYATDIATGKTKWKYHAGAVIRSTPAFDKGNIFFGDCDAHVYSINAENGKLNWIFKINGDTLNNEKFGYDRRAVIASPAIANNIVVVGGRDGFLYGINEANGEKIWQYDYHISWILSSVAIKDSIVVTGTSDGSFINALNITTGKEIWRYQTQAPVWASPSIAGDKIFCPGNDGALYCLDLYTGKEVWEYNTMQKFFSSPVLSGDKLFVGNDDGNFYCFKDVKRNNNDEIFRAVFWMREPPVQFFGYGMDVYIKDYFATRNYKVIDDTAITKFLQSRIGDHKKSVIVFATNFFPSAITGDSAHEGLLLQYLKSGGKVVMCTTNPSVYKFDSANTQITGLDFTQAKRMLDISYPYNDTRSFNGWYPASPTEDGEKWGLKTGYVSRMGLPLNAVDIVLMKDETGKATSWVKTYGGSTGTGFVQTWLSVSTYSTIDEIWKVAEYGME